MKNSLPCRDLNLRPHKYQAYALQIELSRLWFYYFYFCPLRYLSLFFLSLFNFSIFQLFLTFLFERTIVIFSIWTLMNPSNTYQTFSNFCFSLWISILKKLISFFWNAYTKDFLFHFLFYLSQELLDIGRPAPHPTPIEFFAVIFLRCVSVQFKLFLMLILISRKTYNGKTWTVMTTMLSELN